MNPEDFLTIDRFTSKSKSQGGKGGKPQGAFQKGGFGGRPGGAGGRPGGPGGRPGGPGGRQGGSGGRPGGQRGGFQKRWNDDKWIPIKLNNWVILIYELEYFWKHSI